MSTQRERVDARSDARGFVHLCGHLAALLLSGTVLLRVWATVLMVPALLAYAFLLIFLFSAEHECVHRTAFRSRVVNDSVAAFAGIWLLLPSRWFRLFHAAHHRFTQDSANDPELDGWKPPTRAMRPLAHRQKIPAAVFAPWRDSGSFATGRRDSSIHLPAGALSTA